MVVRNDITNEMIIDLYFNKDLNRRQTAYKLKCSQDLIAYRLKNMGLTPKKMSNCVFAGKKRNVKVTKSLFEIINGELLGDGCLIKYYKQADFRESFGYDKKEWAEYLINVFIENDIPIMGKGLYEKKPSGNSNNKAWGFSTLNNVEFGRLHSKWYVKNKNFDKSKVRNFNNRKFIKMVPLDLKFTPDCLLHWYIGDGCTDGNGCTFHVQGFSREEIEFLRYRLRTDIDLKSSYYGLNNVIRISKKERIKMLDIMGECPVRCYQYKWRVNKSKLIKVKINDYINMDMVDTYAKFRR